MHLSEKSFGIPSVWCAIFLLQQIFAYQNYTVPLNNEASFFPSLQDAGHADLLQMPPCGAFQLEEATIDEMQQAMCNGSLTSIQLTLCYVQRIYQTQSYINSLLQLNPDVLQIAGDLDIERQSGKVRSNLHGIPFIVKDNIATKDNLETTAGSWALLGSIVPRDAHVVAKLRESGAVLVGKATLSEWADMRSSNYSEGYSARGGQVRSAYNLAVNPGGSSSGSAVAVGANAIAFSLGTETDGSVINPAMRNAIVGIKPSVGLTSRAGVIPESEHQDSVGCFGRSVRDAVYVLDAIYGADSSDNYTSAQVGHTPNEGFALFLSNKSALVNATFGLPWSSFWIYADDEQISTLTKLLDLLTSAGATIINNTEILDYQTIVSPDGWNWDYGSVRGYPNESEFTVVKVDFYNNIKSYLSELNNTDIQSLEGIVQYNYDNDGTEGGYPYGMMNGTSTGTPAFWSGQDAFLASLQSKGIQDETYFQALDFTQRSSKNGIDHALTAYSTTPLSGLLVPPEVGQSYSIAAQAQYPMITVPVGYHDTMGDFGMPYSLGIMQTMWAETELVRWASAIEDLIKTDGVAFGMGRKRPAWICYKKRNLPVPF